MMYLARVCAEANLADVVGAALALKLGEQL